MWSWVFSSLFFFGVILFGVLLAIAHRGPYKMAREETEKQIARYITARMKTVSPSLSAAQALDDLRMAVESGNYEGNP